LVINIQSIHVARSEKHQVTRHTFLLLRIERTKLLGKCVFTWENNMTFLLFKKVV